MGGRIQVSTKETSSIVPLVTATKFVPIGAKISVAG